MLNEILTDAEGIDGRGGLDTHRHVWLGAIGGDDDFDDLAKIVGACAAARPPLRLPRLGGRRTSHPAPRSTGRRRQPRELQWLCELTQPYQELLGRSQYPRAGRQGAGIVTGTGPRSADLE
jgi:hypothetical protein